MIKFLENPQKLYIKNRAINKMGGEGFEPSTTWSQTRNHTKLDHPPIVCGCFLALKLNYQKKSVYLNQLNTN